MLAEKGTLMGRRRRYRRDRRGRSSSREGHVGSLLVVVMIMVALAMVAIGRAVEAALRELRGVQELAATKPWAVALPCVGVASLIGGGAWWWWRARQHRRAWAAWAHQQW